MVTVFTLNDDTVEIDEFEEDFEALAEVLRLQPGSLGSELGQSFRNPRVYSNIGRWASSEDYQAAVSGGAFFVHLSALYYLATITSDETESVAQGGSPVATSPATAISTFTLHPDADAEAFERAFLGHAGFMAEQEGFISFRLQKSQRLERTYVNLGQWQNPAAYQAVLASPEFRADVERIGAFAQVTPDMVHPFVPAGDQRRLPMAG